MYILVYIASSHKVILNYHFEQGMEDLFILFKLEYRSVIHGAFKMLLEYK